jgi:nitric oxide reductase large subunit
MNVIFILIGMNVTIVFLFDKNKLDDKRSFFKILILNIILFVVASICLLNNIAKNTAINSLFIPLIAQGIYYGLSKLFYLKYDRNSLDTFWTMDKTLFKEGWFNYIFWFISIILFLMVL